ncbi:MULTISPECIES: histidinol dehydrogenase [Bacillus cereus group]|uniref:Histidinol dehydrogenase n=1 Tax=Bacillus thuringiensis TaxID=1428 RepID=A0A9W3V8F7_BACTU|nr:MULTISPECIES: histidinol dehydrogenase [Bacillus cereus group]AMR01861.1 histidinol dehydrogenase [Bacillus thuringiensis]AYF80534.1 histidinol dehydrogenase [Bacillus thuringiensis]EEM84708.1 Histidinol dehydrogenase [Bacillus thuringiensis serovar huazhongensis BGSC 4BD1]EJR78636.1 histidinol dehydrogenase [Bacillus cereus VD156]PNK39111.1 histidinol dehydrogenase [Bacillus thuringiensis]
MEIIYEDFKEALSKIKVLRENANIIEETVQRSVRKIIRNVREGKDEALSFYTKKFDGVEMKDFRVSEEEIQQASMFVENSFLEALKEAKKNIVSYHEKQKKYSIFDCESKGIIRGQLIRQLENVGVYVPGGTASYPSSVLMNVLPAKLAGVKKIVMVTPPSKGGINPHILAAANLAGVDEIYTIGGAQAIAALAYGTESIPKVDKIVGPGNLYVALAKREVYGIVNIDMIAGPSEIVVVADETGNAKYIAADLLSQAEHDERATAICITTNMELAKEVEKEVERQLETLPRSEIARESINRNGAIFIVPSLKEALKLSNEIAPEHLELHIKEPMNALDYVKHAGSIFLGPYAPEPLGDYLAGPNHVLPTSGTARFFSPLSVDDFVKKSSFISYTEEALKNVQHHIVELANKEGLHAHARAIQIRFEEEK